MFISIFLVILRHLKISADFRSFFLICDIFEQLFHLLVKFWLLWWIMKLICDRFWCHGLLYILYILAVPKPSNPKKTPLNRISDQTFQSSFISWPNPHIISIIIFFSRYFFWQDKCIPNTVWFEIQFLPSWICRMWIFQWLYCTKPMYSEHQTLIWLSSE